MRSMCRWVRAQASIASIAKPAAVRPSSSKPGVHASPTSCRDEKVLKQVKTQRNQLQLILRQPKTEFTTCGRHCACMAVLITELSTWCGTYSSDVIAPTNNPNRRDLALLLSLCPGIPSLIRGDPVKARLRCETTLFLLSAPRLRLSTVSPRSDHTTQCRGRQPSS